MLLEHTRKMIEKYNMLRQGDWVIVGVSGGADSVALLHILTRLKEELDLCLKVVHVHHGLRGEEADHDAKFVEMLCKKWNIAYKRYQYDVAGFAKEQRIGIEEAGRRLRYEAFEKELEKLGKGKIAVAHNQNDQAETVLMRLCRGSGLKGLCGIAPVRGNIIRPLLFCSRQEIEAYCHQNTLDYCTDDTNFQDAYTRNKIRIHLLPWLENQLNTKAVEHIAATSMVVAEEEAYLETVAQAYYEKALVVQQGDSLVLKIQALLDMPGVMCNRVLRKALQEVGGSLENVTQEHIGQLEGLLRKTTGKRLSLPSDVSAVIQYENLCLFLHKSDKKTDYFYELSPEKTTFIKEVNKTVLCSYNAEKKQGNSLPLYTKVFDYDKIKNMLCCRSRRPSDVISIEGGHSKKLKNFLIDAKIPASLRQNIPLIASGNEILWVVGYRTAAKFGVDKDTKRVLWIHIWEGNSNE